MTETQKQKWINALRSRKYKQVTGKMFGDAQNECCAMGLLACVAPGASITYEVRREVVERNDVKKQKFYQIARWLERNL